MSRHERLLNILSGTLLTLLPIIGNEILQDIKSISQ